MKDSPMWNSKIYFVAGVLAMALVGMGIWMYQERQRPGIDITIGKGGVSVESR